MFLRSIMFLLCPDVNSGHQEITFPCWLLKPLNYVHRYKAFTPSATRREFNHIIC